MSDLNKPIEKVPTDSTVPTGIDAPNGPKKDWKETVFDEDKGNGDKIVVPTGIDVPGDSGITKDPFKPDTGE
jgi:hypothetical protein